VAPHVACLHGRLTTTQAVNDYILTAENYGKIIEILGTQSKRKIYQGPNAKKCVFIKDQKHI